MDISVVIPLYNEAESLPDLYAQLTENLAGLGKSYEIIFVDDGSTDESFAVLQSLFEKDQHISVIQFRRNYGKAAGLAAGFEQAEGEIVFTLDADLQDDPIELPRFLAKLEEGYDLVLGWKFPRHDPITKTLPSLLANNTVRLSTGLDVHDMNSGYKAMRQVVAKELRLYGELHRYIPMLAHGRGFRVTEIKVRHHARKYGVSKYGAKRLARGLFDFVTVYFLTQFNRRPLHFFGWFGLLSFSLGMVINLYLTILWFSGELIGQRPLLTLGTLLVTIGAQFFSFGLLAEMFSSEVISRNRDYSIRTELKRD